MNFREIFETLTGNEPFPWQSALYEKFVANNLPSTANIPTGLGKTSIIAVWLAALAHYPDRVPRRLVYVVNRRTVVDQTTTEVIRLRDALAKPELAELRNMLASFCALPLPIVGAPPLAISTLRGQFADNGEWCTDPSRPAVIVGTVDIRKLDARIERLLRKAFIDSGLPASLVANAELQWRGTGFIAGADLASRYSTPDQCRRFRRVHVRVVWRERAPDGILRSKKLYGPFCIGSGRFSGLGLFVPTDA